MLERIGGKRFPYRLKILEEDRVLLALKVQAVWPGAGTQVFCLRDSGQGRGGEEFERVPVVSLRRYGKRLAVVLDRRVNKRCDFLFLKKPYKTKEGEYEQIFWRTHQSLRTSRKRFVTGPWKGPPLTIYVDIDEKYPWRFRGCRVERTHLPVGDYALAGGKGLLAVVERKTFDNLLAELGRWDAFHQVLGELEVYPQNALVIESSYGDFLDPKRLHHYTPSFVARALAEISAMHPRLKVVFAHSRKGANEWCRRFFEAVALQSTESIPVQGVDLEETVVPKSRDSDLIFALMEQFPRLPPSFTLGELREAFPHVPIEAIRRFLGRMKAAGKVRCSGRGPKARWMKIQQD